MTEQVENTELYHLALRVGATTLTSSIEVPYIYQYYTTSLEIKDNLSYFYSKKEEYDSSKLRQIALDNYDSNIMVKNIVESIEETIQKFKPQPKYTLSCVQMS